MLLRTISVIQNWFHEILLLPFSISAEVSGAVGVELCYVKAMTTIRGRLQSQMPIKAKLMVMPEEAKIKFSYIMPKSVCIIDNAKL